jgi:hypothetical protein
MPSLVIFQPYHGGQLTPHPIVDDILISNNFLFGIIDKLTNQTKSLIVCSDLNLPDFVGSLLIDQFNA